jgi:hypothetical protein
VNDCSFGPSLGYTQFAYFTDFLTLSILLICVPSFHQTPSLLRGSVAGAKDEDARNLLQHAVRRIQGLDINAFVPPPSSFPGISVQLPAIFPVSSPSLQVPAIPGPPPTPGKPGYGTLVLTSTLSVQLPDIFPVPGRPGPQLSAIPGAPPTPGKPGYGTLVLTPTLSVQLPDIFPAPGRPGPQLPAIPGPPAPPPLPGQAAVGTLVVTP